MENYSWNILGTIFIGSMGCAFSMLILTNVSIFLFESDIINAPSVIANNISSREELLFNNYTVKLWWIPFNWFCSNLGHLSLYYLWLCFICFSISFMNESSMESSKSLRLLFAILLVIQPTLLMYLNGVDSFKWIMVICSIPLLFIYILLVYSVLKNVHSIKES